MFYFVRIFHFFASCSYFNSKPFSLFIINCCCTCYNVCFFHVFFINDLKIFFKIKHKNKLYVLLLICLCVFVFCVFYLSMVFLIPCHFFWYYLPFTAHFALPDRYHNMYLTALKANATHTHAIAT